MARYYFNIRHGNDLFEDDHGSEHVTQHDAWSEAVRACGEMLRDLNGKLQVGQEWRLEVTKEKHEIVFVLRALAEKGPGFVSQH
jgi:hypothetical protein